MGLFISSTFEGGAYFRGWGLFILVKRGAILLSQTIKRWYQRPTTKPRLWTKFFAHDCSFHNNYLGHSGNINLRKLRFSRQGLVVKFARLTLTRIRVILCKEIERKITRNVRNRAKMVEKYDKCFVNRAKIKRKSSTLWYKIENRSKSSEDGRKLRHTFRRSSRITDLHCMVTRWIFSCLATETTKQLKHTKLHV